MHAIPSTIEDQDFPLVKRGFDPDSVRAFLAEVAEAFRELERHARADSMRLSALDRQLRDSKAAEHDVGATLIAASDTKARIIAAAENRAREIIAVAERRAAGIAPEPLGSVMIDTGNPGSRIQAAEDEAADFVRKAAETRRLAVREAEETVAAARREALEVLGAAKSQAEDVMAQAMVERDRVLGRLRRLREVLTETLGQGHALEAELQDVLGIRTVIEATAHAPAAVVVVD